MPEAPAFVASTRAQVEAWVERGRATILGRIWERLLEVTFVETSIALAAKAFVALFPLLIIIASVAPEAVRLAIITALRNRMGLDASTTDVVTGAFQTPENVRHAISVLGLIYLFFYATTFTTALQRVYLRAWRRPRRGGLTNQGRGLLWIVGVAVGIALLGGLRRVVAGAPASAAALVIVVGSAVVLWWWTAWMLLRGDVRWRVLLPGAVVTATGMLTYALSANIWMPRTVRGELGAVRLLRGGARAGHVVHRGRLHHRRGGHDQRRARRGPGGARAVDPGTQRRGPPGRCTRGAARPGGRAAAARRPAARAGRALTTVSHPLGSLLRGSGFRRLLTVRVVGSARRRLLPGRAGVVRLLLP